jgi:putative hydrolase of the HAD superfamily
MRKTNSPRSLDALGVDRDHVWHVGDSLSADVDGAKRAGLAAVWLNRSGRTCSTGEAEPDVEIRSLAELTGLLAKSSLV